MSDSDSDSDCGVACSKSGYASSCLLLSSVLLPSKVMIMVSAFTLDAALAYSRSPSGSRLPFSQYVHMHHPIFFGRSESYLERLEVGVAAMKADGWLEFDAGDCETVAKVLRGLL